MKKMITSDFGREVPTKRLQDSVRVNSIIWQDIGIIDLMIEGEKYKGTVL